MSSIKEKIKSRIALERETYEQDRRYYLVPSWGMVFWLLTLGVLGAIIIGTGGLNGSADNHSVPGTAGPHSALDRERR